MEKTFFGKKFHTMDLGKLKYFLDTKIDHSSQGIFLSQRKYALDLMKL